MARKELAKKQDDDKDGVDPVDSSQEGDSLELNKKEVQRLEKKQKELGAVKAKIEEVYKQEAKAAGLSPEEFESGANKRVRDYLKSKSEEASLKQEIKKIDSGLTKTKIEIGLSQWTGEFEDSLEFEKSYDKAIKQRDELKRALSKTKKEQMILLGVVQKEKKSAGKKLKGEKAAETKKPMNDVGEELEAGVAAGVEGPEANIEPSELEIGGGVKELGVDAEMEKEALERDDKEKAVDKAGSEVLPESEAGKEKEPAPNTPVEASSESLAQQGLSSEQVDVVASVGKEVAVEVKDKPNRLVGGLVKVFKRLGVAEDICDGLEGALSSIAEKIKGKKEKPAIEAEVISGGEGEAETGETKERIRIRIAEKVAGETRKAYENLEKLGIKSRVEKVANFGGRVFGASLMFGFCYFLASCAFAFSTVWGALEEFFKGVGKELGVETKKHK